MHVYNIFSEFRWFFIMYSTYIYVLIHIGLSYVTTLDYITKVLRNARSG